MLREARVLGEGGACGLAVIQRDKKLVDDHILIL